MASRREKLLHRIDPKVQRGLEVGPLDRPVVGLSEGYVRYVDFATTEELRAQRANDSTVDVSKLAPVHFVWGARTLREAVGDETFDYVVASHVVEHVPDLAGWFREIAEVLRPGGMLSLIVPDKRFTFDRLRPDTRIGDVVEAYVEHRRRPSARQIFEHFGLHTRVEIAAAWAGEVEDSKLQRVHTEAYALGVAEEASRSGSYVDSHCWVFTPASFFGVIKSLMELGLFDFRVAEYHPPHLNEMDFFVTFERLHGGSVPLTQIATGLASLPEDFNALNILSGAAERQNPAQQLPPSSLSPQAEGKPLTRRVVEGLADPLGSARKIAQRLRGARRK